MFTSVIWICCCGSPVLLETHSNGFFSSSSCFWIAEIILSESSDVGNGIACLLVEIWLFVPFSNLQFLFLENRSCFGKPFFHFLLVLLLVVSQMTCFYLCFDYDGLSELFSIVPRLFLDQQVLFGKFTLKVRVVFPF